MTKISDLPRDLAEEVLSRVPVTSLRAVRFTCKKWNTLTKHRSFTKKLVCQAKAEPKKKQAKEFYAIMTMNYKVYLMSVNLDEIHKDDNVESSIKQKGKLISLNVADRILSISQVCHCDGLLLCITNDNSRLVVWNPYSGQTRRVQPRISYKRWDYKYALGYEMKNNSYRSHKILRFRDSYLGPFQPLWEFEIYNLNSNSWKDVEVTPDWTIDQHGVSLKGNTYWSSLRHKSLHFEILEEIPGFLLCFDFTTEKFGRRLPLPFKYPIREDTLTLSIVREEQLAVLGQHQHWTEIWISNKIEPNAVSWSKLFLIVDEIRLDPARAATFFVDEEENVAVVFDKGKWVRKSSRNTANIVGVDGYDKEADLGESVHKYCFPLVCSYVPSSVEI
ncbi:F-box domain [Arabidopsis thaliana x Arabidopsis arenosa]|uniref:F-box domain n=1 Tax=Arabidopsis thaliana x Arabidopsis arenosa TaxID=1240361 RepID=A0A8T2ATX4_9BRAS|nr:F-box domain [Arabidopsis thaliana x Arabidopsis arenosa]